MNSHENSEPYDLELGVGTYVNLHGYFHLWFPFERAAAVVGKLMVNNRPRIVRNTPSTMTVLNIQAARIWDFEELTYWPQVARGEILVMELDPSKARGEQLRLITNEDELACVRAFAESAYLGKPLTD